MCILTVAGNGAVASEDRWDNSLELGGMSIIHSYTGCWCAGAVQEKKISVSVKAQMGVVVLRPVVWNE